VKQAFKRAIAALLTLTAAFVISGTTAAQAEQSTNESKNINLPAGILIADQNGISVDSHGYYYIDVRGLEPNDAIFKVITLQNLDQTPYTLYMTAEPLFARGPEDLLEKVRLTLKLNGKTVYDGPCRGNGTPNMIQNAISLGTFATGDRSTLDVTMIVASDLQLFEEKSEADFRWHFYANRSAPAQPPKTGLLQNYWLLLPIAALLLFSSLLLIGVKRRMVHAAHA